MNLQAGLILLRHSICPLRAGRAIALPVYNEEKLMIECIGGIMSGEDEDDVRIVLGEDHDDIEYQFLMFVGGKTGATLKFEGYAGATVGKFFEMLDAEPGNPTETSLLKFLDEQDDLAVLVAFDGEPRTFVFEEEE